MHTCNRPLQTHYSSTPIYNSFAFLQSKNKELKQVGSHSTCSDWLVEWVQGTCRHPGGYPKDVTGEKRIVLDFYPPNKKTFLQLAIPFLNLLEKHNGLHKTRVMLRKQHGAFILVMDKRWRTNTFMISLYTKLLRNAAVLKESPTTALQFDTKFWQRDTYMASSFLESTLLTKILFSGRLLDVIKNDTTPHGCLGTEVPEHGNTGLYYTLQRHLHPKTYPESERNPQLALLQQQLEGVDLNALSLM